MKAQNIALETEPVKELKYQIESKSGLPDALTHIIECISFWNKEGVICYQNSKTTIWPDEQKNRTCKTISYEDFILWMISSDCEAFVISNPQYLTGKGGHHVWIADRDTNDRILFIFFEVTPPEPTKTPKRRFKVNPKYTHFAISKTTNKIVDGWDYKGMDKESIKFYTAIDLKDNDRLVKDFRIVGKSKVIKSGIDPMDWNNWGSN